MELFVVLHCICVIDVTNCNVGAIEEKWEKGDFVSAVQEILRVDVPKIVASVSLVL
jgi:hypothetical protein